MDIKNAIIVGVVVWFLSNFLVPLLVNSIERIYQNQIDCLLKRFVGGIQILACRLLQILLIVFFSPTLLSLIPNFMRAQAEKEYKPVATVLVDSKFPRQLFNSWSIVRGTILGLPAVIILFILFIHLGCSSQVIQCR